LRTDRPDQDLKRGEVGTIVHVFDTADASTWSSSSTTTTACGFTRS
jgi:hypothetical protein